MTDGDTSNTWILDEFYLFCKIPSPLAAREKGRGTAIQLRNNCQHRNMDVCVFRTRSSQEWFDKTLINNITLHINDLVHVNNF